MKRIAAIVALIVSAATPAVAQWAGMPVWNNPKGGTGVTVDGDLGFPNSNGGKGTAFGARATLGLTNLSLTAGITSWKPNGYNSSVTSVGGVAGFKVIGGSLIPVAVNLQLGAGTTNSVTQGLVTVPKTTTIIAGAGASVNLPTPGMNVEPYLSITNRWNTPSGGGTSSNVGWVIGANIGLGMLGLHVAYDSQKIATGVTRGVIGIGVHVAAKAPIGM
jgi:opacity protein-like surface antigen